MGYPVNNSGYPLTASTLSALFALALGRRLLLGLTL